MMDFSYETLIKSRQERYGFRFKHKLGQNFLIDEGVLDAIVAAAATDPTAQVLEIGAGMGFLTEKLSDVFPAVTAVELDESLCVILREIAGARKNITVLPGDALELSLSELGGTEEDAPRKIVANLPYYITTPLIFHFLEQREHWQEMILMVQKEVAERVVAAPGGKDYGVLTLMTAYAADAEILFTVPAKAFYPRPAVDSAVLRFVGREHPPCPVTDATAFRALVKAAFAQRRKTLANALKNSGLFAGGDDVTSLLATCAIDGGRRGETLSFAEFAALANAYVNGE